MGAKNTMNLSCRGDADMNDFFLPFFGSNMKDEKQVSRTASRDEELIGNFYNGE